MIRFLTTLVITLALAVAAAAWWTGADDPEPVAIETGEASAALEPGLTPVEPEAAPSVPALPELASPARTVPDPKPPEPAARELPPIPPIPAPHFEAPPVRTLAAIPAPEFARPEQEPPPEAAAALPEETPPVEETELPTLPAFETPAPGEPTTIEAILAANPDLGPTAEEELEQWEESQKTVALGSEHDRSASRIRRLLDVYEGLRGRR